MRKYSHRLAMRALNLSLGFILTLTLGCGMAPLEEANARKPVVPTASVDTMPLEEQPEIDGDVYLPYYKEADLPKLEMIPLETPGKATDERVEDLMGNFNPAYPDRPRFRPRPHRPKHQTQSEASAEEELPYWFADLAPSRRPATPEPQQIQVYSLPDGSMPAELHGEIVAFLRTYPALTAGEFQIRPIRRKGIYDVVYFTPHTRQSDPHRQWLSRRNDSRSKRGTASGRSAAPRWRCPMSMLKPVPFETSKRASRKQNYANNRTLPIDPSGVKAISRG